MTRTMDEERVYLEELLTKRFNFYFVFAGAAAAGATQISDHFEQGLILIVASIVSACFWRPLYRTYDLIKVIIHKIEGDKEHPLTIARDESDTSLGLGDANWYFGQLIPGVITVVFFIFGAIRLGGLVFFSSAAV